MSSGCHMIQESEEMVRRREVGCQWESPQEERREVGCQSDSAERRDAAVQVDLLTQQLSWRHTGVCGAAWRCVSVRADEPGGGALLQHCSTDGTHTLDTGQQHTHHSPPLYLLCCPLTHSSPLPTMPQLGPPAPPDLHRSKELTTLPSMPLCGVSPTAGERSDASPLTAAGVSVPPPGLIAPLSPRLAEEEEEEGSLFQHEEDESFHGNRQPTMMTEKKRRRQRRKMVGPPIRYLLESEEQSHVLLTANQDRARGPKKRGRPKKADSKTGGGASEVTERQTGDRDTERQTGDRDTERQTGDMDTERQIGDMDTERQTGDRDTERQTGDRDTAPDWSKRSTEGRRVHRLTSLHPQERHSAK
ncbi:uncharacterized protein LOC126397544 [Epinephelus moara]|uniref:uncharacterized protein LOC126397544 n=1 Tax=Epinephelus moara TaxID=300413 RepID=UPI00214E0C2E|nr:uncharacterized protein LOC126397544 [Epinephelus moara]